jgi:cellobiose-specific phosphotransferase system component IIA
MSDLNSAVTISGLVAAGTSLVALISVLPAVISRKIGPVSPKDSSSRSLTGIAFPHRSRDELMDHVLVTLTVDAEPELSSAGVHHGHADQASERNNVVIGITGEAGAGKSSFLRALSEARDEEGTSATGPVDEQSKALSDLLRWTARGIRRRATAVQVETLGLVPSQRGNDR